jgi:hypothetical protein
MVVKINSEFIILFFLINNAYGGFLLKRFTSSLNRLENSTFTRKQLGDQNIKKINIKSTLNISNPKPNRKINKNNHIMDNSV